MKRSSSRFPFALVFFASLAVLLTGVTRQRYGPSTTRPGGSVTSGWALVLAPRSQAVLPAAPIALNLEVKNVSSSEMYLVGPEVLCSYRIRVTDMKSGMRLPTHLPATGCDVYGAGGIFVPVGRSWFITIPVTDFIAPPQPGSYVIQVENIRVYGRGSDSTMRTLPARSNSVTVTVLAPGREAVR